jgi:hypothetical protein
MTSDEKKLDYKVILPPSQNIVSWRVQILCQNIRSWKDKTKLNEVGE